jgi:hypothetical protein
MKNSKFIRAAIAPVFFSLCAAGPPPNHPMDGAEKLLKDYSSRMRPVNIITTPVPETSWKYPDPHCDVYNSNNPPASKAIQLHIRSVLFNHLADGKNYDCTRAPTTCNAYVTVQDIQPTTALCQTTPAVGGITVAQTYCLDTEKAGNPISTISLPQTPTSTQTHLDIDFNGSDSLTHPIWGSSVINGNKYPILLEIVLDDKSLSFIPGPLGDDDSSSGVQVDAKTAGTYPSMFECRQQPIYKTDNTQTIKLRVNHWINPLKAIGFLNIGVIVKECSDGNCPGIPIILDPHFPNNG